MKQGDGVEYENFIWQFISAIEKHFRIFSSMVNLHNSCMYNVYLSTRTTYVYIYTNGDKIELIKLQD